MPELQSSSSLSVGPASSCWLAVASVDCRGRSLMPPRTGKAAQRDLIIQVLLQPRQHAVELDLHATVHVSALQLGSATAD